MIVTLLGYALATAIVVPVLALVAIYGGFVLYVLWGWFIVPLGVPQIGIAWAIGISTVFHLIAPSQPLPKTDDEHVWQNVAYVLLKPFIALAIGWTAKSFM